MASMDDIRKKAEDGLKTLKETAQDIAFTVEKQAKIGKMKYIDLARIERNMERVFREIGEYVYDELTAGRDIQSDDPYIGECIRSIGGMRAERDDIEADIADIQKTEPGHAE